MKKLKMILAAIAVAGVTALPMASAEAFFWPFGGRGGPWGGYPGWGGYPYGGGYPGYWGGYPYGGYVHPYAYPYAAPTVPQTKSAE